MTQLTPETCETLSIKDLITTFFAAINASDPSSLGPLFFPHANLVILRQDPPLKPSSSNYPQYSHLPVPRAENPSPESKEKLSVVIRTDIETFIKMLEDGKKRRDGQPDLPELHEEPDLKGTVVKIDSEFGMAWSPFHVTFDGVLHHYGSLVYTLGKVENEKGEKEWKIEGLTQNYRRTPGWGPPHEPGFGHAD